MHLALDAYVGLHDTGSPVLADGHKLSQVKRSRQLREDAETLRRQADHQVKRAKLGTWAVRRSLGQARNCPLALRRLLVRGAAGEALTDLVVEYEQQLLRLRREGQVVGLFEQAIDVLADRSEIALKEMQTDRAVGAPDVSDHTARSNA